MKNTATVLALFFFLLMLPKLQAKHILSGTMSYKCIGDGEYEITMTIFRVCSGQGASFDSPALIALYKGEEYVSSALWQFDSTEIVEYDGFDNCKPDIDNICFEKGIYRFKVNLPNSEDNYALVYQRCCWSNAIANIDQPELRGITIRTEISAEARSLCNSQQEIDFPLAFSSCPGKMISIPLPAFDMEGDSLVYEICMPLEGGGPFGSVENPGDPVACNGILPTPACQPPYNTLPFAPGFDIENPFPTEDGITFNPETNALEFVPTVLGNFIYGICISEYRDGGLISMQRASLKLSNTLTNSVNTKELRQEPLSFFYDYNHKEIFMEGEISTATRLLIYNLNGQLVKEFPSNSTSFFVGSLAPAIYLVRSSNKDQSSAQKLFIF